MFILAPLTFFVFIFAPLYLAVLSRRRHMKMAASLGREVDRLREAYEGIRASYDALQKASNEDASKLYHASGNVELLRARLDESDNGRHELNTRLMETDANLARANDRCLTKDVEIEKLRYELGIAEFWRQKLVKMIDGLANVEGPQNAARRFKLVEIKPAKKRTTGRLTKVA